MTQKTRKTKSSQVWSVITVLVQAVVYFFGHSRFWVGLSQWFSRFYQSIQQWQWSAIFLSLTTAFIFWIFHQLNQDHSANLEFAIALDVDTDSFITVKAPPKSISFNVNGYGWVLLSKSLGISKENILIHIEDPMKSKYLTGEKLKAIASAQLKSNVVINQAVEDTIKFDFDTMATKKVFVTYNTSNIPIANNHWLASKVKVKPDHVWVKGTSGKLSKLGKTLPLVLDNLPTSELPFRGNVPVNLPQDQFMHLEKPYVQVSFDVSTYKEEEAIAKLILEHFPDDQQYRVVPDFGIFKYRVNVETQVYFQDTLKIYLDYRRMLPDSTILPVAGDSITLPSFRIYPESFKIEVKKSEEE